MPHIEKFKNYLKSDWLISFVLFLTFLATNGYTYAWDDQHLEIPLLKSLIDTTLYNGDYYVEALKASFTSFLFPLLARIITVPQIPTTYFVLYLLSRFFLFFYAYKIWKLITRKQLTAALCVLSFFIIFRVEEFLYRTFSHQEFALAIIMAGIYYFYKNRFFRAAILFGIAANFHALYSLFPFCYMVLYLLKKAREDRAKILSKTIGLFILLSAPLILWTFKRFSLHSPIEPALYQNWVQLYLLACPATFPFDNLSFNNMLKSLPIFLKGTQQFWPVAAFVALNLTQNPAFNKDQKAKTFIVGGSLFVFLSFIFSYIFPIRIVLDLNLMRNLQFMQFILVGYTTILISEKIKNSLPTTACALVILFSLLRFGNYVTTLSCLAMLFLLQEKKSFFNQLGWIFFAASLTGIYFQFRQNHFSHSAINMFFTIAGIMIFLCLTNFFIKNTSLRLRLRLTMILVPFFLLTFNNIFYHYLRIQVETKSAGFWQLQRNWIDMQNYVRTHTDKNALILTPNDMEMGGFRIFSERKVLVCYRDCGVIGFDYKAAIEWQKRLNDVKHFKVFIDGDIKPALQNAILKYKVNYIVFMRYLNPKENTMLNLVYENETFALYRVSANPI